MPATAKQISAACKVVTEEALALERLQAEKGKVQGKRDAAMQEITDLNAEIDTQRARLAGAQTELKTLLDQA